MQKVSNWAELYNKRFYHTLQWTQLTMNYDSNTAEDITLRCQECNRQQNTAEELITCQTCGLTKCRNCMMTVKLCADCFEENMETK